MARIPDGGVLIANPVTDAPGFQIGNVFVMAGVPRIMQAMLDAIMPHVKGGAPVLWSAAVAIEHQRSTGSGGSGERRLRLSTISYWHFLQRHCPAWVRALRGLRLVLMALIKLPRQPARSCSVLQGWLQALGDPIR
jgi:hypothetical protein